MTTGRKATFYRHDQYHNKFNGGGHKCCDPTVTFTGGDSGWQSLEDRAPVLVITQAELDTLVAEGEARIDEKWSVNNANLKAKLYGWKTSFMRLRRAIMKLHAIEDHRIVDRMSADEFQFADAMDVIQAAVQAHTQRQLDDEHNAAVEATARTPWLTPDHIEAILALRRQT